MKKAQKSLASLQAAKVDSALAQAHFKHDGTEPTQGVSGTQELSNIRASSLLSMQHLASQAPLSKMTLLKPCPVEPTLRGFRIWVAGGALCGRERRPWWSSRANFSAPARAAGTYPSQRPSQQTADLHEGQASNSGGLNLIPPFWSYTNPSTRTQPTFFLRAKSLGGGALPPSFVSVPDRPLESRATAFSSFS